MPPIGDLTILVPVDISEPESPKLRVLDILRPFEVVLLGYFPVPDQAEPALIKHEYEEEATGRLEEISQGWGDLTEVLVFTHDRDATVDRVADQYDCDVVLTAGDTETIDRILVPIRSDANLERIVYVVACLLQDSTSTVTFFHSASKDADPSQGEFLLKGTVERLAEYGIEEERADWQLSDGGDVITDIVDIGAKYDIVILGETEPSLRKRIIGDVLSRIIDKIEIPALIVRDVE